MNVLIIKTTVLITLYQGKMAQSWKYFKKCFRFYYLWLYFVYQNLQNGYFWISLLNVFFEVVYGSQ